MKAARHAGIIACALGIGLASGEARAYPTSVVYAPSGEALPFGSFSVGTFASLGLSPEPVHFGVAWGGFDVGVIPSIDIARTTVGTIAFAGAEIGFDGFGPDADGAPTGVFNVKLQLLKDAKYWPAIAIGMFQISPNAKRSPLLGYFALSKSFSVGDIDLGQLTFGMMKSFADETRIAPQCFVSGAPSCLFRGSEPFLDGNGAFLAGYLSPWIGPVGFGIDYVGGTSAVSSANVAVNFRLWQDGSGGFLAAGIGGYLSNDRRKVPAGPGADDGLFVQITLVTSLTGLFGWDPTKEWSGTNKKKRGRGVRAEPEDLLEAPPITAPVPTTTPREPDPPASPATPTSPSP